MKKRLLIPFICISLCLPVAALADSGSARPGCEICGMYIDQYHDTSTHLTLKSGETKDTCGVACMLRIVNDKGGPDAFSKIEVRDWMSKKSIPAGDAHYVIGSRLMPDMMPNLIAFEKLEDAEAFRLKEGGTILNFTKGLMSISPMGMTMPARIKTAALPPQGALNVGVGYMYMAMDKVQSGSDSICRLPFN